MRPLKVPPEILKHAASKDQLLTKVSEIRAAFEKHLSAKPEVSIVIPAFNEGSNILATLSSLSASTSSRTFEVVVVDNNSTDDTAALVAMSGATCISEIRQGITPARNRGLTAARGLYVLNADADTIYPSKWIDLMIEPLEHGMASLTYGSHSFLSTKSKHNTAYLAYEYLADLKKWLNRKFREEAVNVYGFNSAFIREEGLEVNGFDHPPGTNEDGWMAVKLRKHTGRRLFLQRNEAARAWTSNRRLMADGGLLKATIKRLFSS
jgi:glycosyltransferase involved in cell wall biosynthesis